MTSDPTCELHTIADGLVGSVAPKIVGLAHLSTQGQRLAVRLGMLARCNLDGGGNNGRGNMFALQKRGRVTATLGEIKNRSDLVVFWFCQPDENTPLLLELAEADGRNVVFVGPTMDFSTTGSTSRTHIGLEAQHAAQAIWLIRAFVDEVELADEVAQDLPVDQLSELANQFKSSCYGAIIWGSDHCDAAFDLQADGIHTLLRQLNEYTRAVGIPIRVDANGLSSENVLAWNTGFPFAVNLYRGAPRHNWLEWSDEDISKRDEWDALLNVERGKIVYVSRDTESGNAQTIEIPVAVFPGEEDGDACRMDDVAYYRAADREADLPTATEIFRRLLGRVEQNNTHRV